jgi:hypothetical protein
LIVGSSRLARSCAILDASSCAEPPETIMPVVFDEAVSGVDEIMECQWAS